MKDRVVVHFDKRDVEELKLIKLDLLGLRMLSAIDDAVRDIRVDCGVCLDLDRLPEDLPEVFAMIQAADTVGVFQIESRAQMQSLLRTKPETIDDLVTQSVGRALDLFGIDLGLFKRWGEEPEEGDETTPTRVFRR